MERKREEGKERSEKVERERLRDGGGGGGITGGERGRKENN